MSLVEWINNQYDINEGQTAEINLDYTYDNEDVVAIIGESGTGKTTLLRKWFDTDEIAFKVDSDKIIFEILFNMIGDEDEVSQLLFDVGLASIPMWKNTYNQISNGEKLRFEIAYKLAHYNEVFFIDEYTSMLDRQTAMNLSRNLNGLLEKYDKKCVLVTCHFDVLDWIAVDKVVNTTTKKLHSHKSKTLITHKQLKSEEYQEICGEYLSSITI